MTISKACGRVGALLPAYAVGALGPAELQAVADHLGQCETCRQQLREWKSIISAAHVAASGPPPSPDNLDRIRARIDASQGSGHQSERTVWARKTGGHHRGWRRPSTSLGGHDVHARRPIRRGRSAVAEIAVIGLLVVILGGGLISRGWWEQMVGDDPTATPQELAAEQVTAQNSETGRFMFSSVLSNVATHPGASLLLGRLTIETGSSTGLQAEGPVTLLVESGIISGLVDGPAVITHDHECEVAGQTQELVAGEQFELQPSDHMVIPIGTAPELQNTGEDLAQLFDIRIQTPGPPLRIENGVQYRQVAQTPANQLPSGEVNFSLVEGSLTTEVMHEIDGPGLFYVETGAVEVAGSTSRLEIKGRDDLDLDDVPDGVDDDPDEQLAPGSWFFVKAGDQASLIVANGEATFLELLFDAQEARSNAIPHHVALP